MPDVLIRDVPESELAELKAAAAERHVSLQTYLRDSVHAQADYIRRQAALAAAGDRLVGRSSVTHGERQAVLDAIDAAHDDRAAELGDPSSR